MIGPVFGSVCQRLIVLWYWTPGSAHCQAASAICSISSRAFTVLITRPSVRAIRFQSSSLATASMNSSVTRTELFAFWNWTESNASESSHMSKSAAFRAAAFFLIGLAPDELLDVGMVDVEDDHLRRPPGAAARLDPPAQESAPRMKLTGPEAIPPLEEAPSSRGSSRG